MSISTNRIRWLLPLLFAAAATAGPAVQAGPRPSGGAAAEIALHFKHEDALYGTTHAASQPRTRVQLMALHFQHEDALYDGGRLVSGLRTSGRTQAYPDAFARAVNVHESASYPDAFGRAVNIHNGALKSHDEAMAGPSQVDRSLGISATPVHDEAIGGASQVDRALGTSTTRDAAVTTRVIVRSGDFDWGDAGIGAGGGIGLVLLLGAASSLVIRQKHRLSNA
jgi:hypothetical protein